MGSLCAKPTQPANQRWACVPELESRIFSRESRSELSERVTSRRGPPELAPSPIEPLLQPSPPPFVVRPLARSARYIRAHARHGALSLHRSSRILCLGDSQQKRTHKRVPIPGSSRPTLSGRAPADISLSPVLRPSTSLLSGAHQSGVIPQYCPIHPRIYICPSRKTLQAF